MRCKLCGNPTNKLFDIYHEECYQQLSSELLVLDAIYNRFKDGTYTLKVAKSKFIEVASTGYANTLFTNNVVNQSDINTYDKIVYSYLGVGVSEEKNRCQMKRTGLSYARYPQWQPEIYRICNSALIVFQNCHNFTLRTFFFAENKIRSKDMEEQTKKDIYEILEQAKVLEELMKELELPLSENQLSNLKVEEFHINTALCNADYIHDVVSRIDSVIAAL